MSTRLTTLILIRRSLEREGRHVKWCPVRWGPGQATAHQPEKFDNMTMSLASRSLSHEPACAALKLIKAHQHAHTGTCASQTQMKTPPSAWSASPGHFVHTVDKQV